MKKPSLALKRYIGLHPPLPLVVTYIYSFKEHSTNYTTGNLLVAERETDKRSVATTTMSTEDHSRNVSAEKERATHSSPNSTELGEAPRFDAEQTKTLLRRLDWHLVPFLALLYLYEYGLLGIFTDR